LAPVYAIILDVVQRAYRSSTITLANPTTHRRMQMPTMRSVFTMPTAITILAFQDNIILTSVMVMWHFSSWTRAGIVATPLPTKLVHGQCWVKLS